MKRKCYITGRRLSIKGMVPLMTYKGENIEVKVKLEELGLKDTALS